MPKPTLSDLEHKRVSYECTFRNSKAALTRFAEALFKYQAYKMDSFPFKTGNDLTCLVRLQPRLSLEFVKLVKPIYWRYKSPDLFDGRGTLHSIYASPEDEVFGNERDSIAKIRECLAKEE